jgi:hypothetical protein
MQSQVDIDDALIAQFLGSRYLGRRYLRYAELEALGSSTTAPRSSSGWTPAAFLTKFPQRLAEREWPVHGLRRARFDLSPTPPIFPSMNGRRSRRQSRATLRQLAFGDHQWMLLGAFSPGGLSRRGAALFHSGSPDHGECQVCRRRGFGGCLSGIKSA